MSSECYSASAPGTVLAAAVLVLCGCAGDDQTQPARAAVSGSVTLDGRPLAEGVVRFVPIDGTKGPKTSVAVAQGKFSAEKAYGPVVGTHRIEIESTDTGGYARDDEQAIQKLREAGVRRIEVVRVPSVYNARSRLKETVSAEGPNEFTFELRSGNHR